MSVFSIKFSLVREGFSPNANSARLICICVSKRGYYSTLPLSGRAIDIAPRAPLTGDFAPNFCTEKALENQGHAVVSNILISARSAGRCNVLAWSAVSAARSIRPGNLRRAAMVLLSTYPDNPAEASMRDLLNKGARHHPPPLRLCGLGGRLLMAAIAVCVASVAPVHAAEIKVGVFDEVVLEGKSGRFR